MNRLYGDLGVTLIAERRIWSYIRNERALRSVTRPERPSAHQAGSKHAATDRRRQDAQFGRLEMTAATPALRLRRQTGESGAETNKGGASAEEGQAASARQEYKA